LATLAAALRPTEGQDCALLTGTNPDAATARIAQL
jgi:hypothetical protein